METKKRTLEDLKMRSQLVLRTAFEHRRKFTEIARENTPSQAHSLAKFYSEGTEEISPRAEDYAKSCRFLSMIKRDYEADFEKVVA
jgi:hypothetical protein